MHEDGTDPGNDIGNSHKTYPRKVFFDSISRYGFALRRAAEGLSWLLTCGSLPQSLRSSLGAPAGGVLNVLSMQGIALRYS